MGQQRIAKELKPGRVLIVSHANHYNKLAILLTVSAVSGKEPTYRVLVLDDLVISTVCSEIKLLTMVSRFCFRSFFLPLNDRLLFLWKTM